MIDLSKVILPTPPDLTGEAPVKEKLAQVQTFLHDLIAALSSFDFIPEGRVKSILDTNTTDTPTTDPGWTTSSTVNMTAPDGYIQALVNGALVVMPYWDT